MYVMAFKLYQAPDERLAPRAP